MVLRFWCLWGAGLWVGDDFEEAVPIGEDDVGCDTSELFEEVVSSDPGHHGVTRPAGTDLSVP